MGKEYVISAYSIAGSPIKGMNDVMLAAETLKQAAQTYMQGSKLTLDVLVEADAFILLGGPIAETKAKECNAQSDTANSAVARFLVAQF
jgi:hypothetical protein